MFVFVKAFQITALHKGNIMTTRQYEFELDVGKMKAYFSIHSSLNARFSLSNFLLFVDAIIISFRIKLIYK